MILSLYLITPFLRKVMVKIERKSINYLVFIWIIFMVLVPFLNVIFKKNIKVYSPAGQYIGYFLIGYLLAEKPLNMKKWQNLTQKILLFPRLIPTQKWRKNFSQLLRQLFWQQIIAVRRFINIHRCIQIIGMKEHFLLELLRLERRFGNFWKVKIQNFIEILRCMDRHLSVFIKRIIGHELRS